MHIALSADGRITSAGPTLRKLAAGQGLVGAWFFALFEVRRPGGILTMADLAARQGERLHLGLRPLTEIGLRGVAQPLAVGKGLLVNLSFGIGVIEAVRAHGLTDADFAATDLATELHYLVEAKAAVLDELRALNRRLEGARLAAEERALTDTLTGLRNRRALDADLDRLCLGAKPFGVMHIDLDHFKAVNDGLGHAAGDHVLTEVARVLLAETRSRDTVARVGGDEFVILLPDCDGHAALDRIARRIILRLRRPILFEGQPCRISASIGTVLSSDYLMPDRDQLLADADQALYSSKRGGRGRATRGSGAPGA